MIFILNKQERVVNILRNEGGNNQLPPFFDDVYTQDLATGTETFSFSTIAINNVAKDLVVGNYVAFKDDEGQYKLFQITQTEEYHEEAMYINVYAECAGLELINKVFRSRKAPSTSLRKFMEMVLDETGWNIGLIPVLVQESVDLELEDATVYATLQNNLSKYGVEMAFRCEINNGRISSKYVDLYTQRGRVTGKRFSFGRDIEGIKRKVDSTELFTALIGRGNNNINFKDITVAGIDKPLGQDYVADQEAFNRYNNNGYHIVGIYNYDTDSPEELLRETSKQLEKCKQPKVEYEISVALLGELLGQDWNKVSIGDTVSIVDNAFNPPIHLMARVSKLEKSFTDNQSNTCTLANFVEVQSNISDSMRKIASELENYVNSKFPIGSNDITEGAINGTHMDNAYMTQVSADIVKASLVEAKKIVADEIHASEGRFDSVVTDKIQASEGKFETILTDKIQASEGKFETILTNKIQATEGKFQEIITDKVEAIDGKFEKVESDIVKANTVMSNLGKFDTVIAGRVEAVEGDFTKINAKLADINTIVSGNISSDNIQTGGITGENLNMDTIFVSDANITSVNANKINAGTINTKNVHIESENGGIVIADNTQQFKDKNGKVRIQMGQDAQGNFNFGVYDEAGTGVLIDATGVKEKALADGIIKDRMIGQGEINGSKIDVNSLVSEVNKDTNTSSIKGSKILLDTEGQKLDIAFNSLKTQANDTKKKTESNTTQIGVEQGRINTLIKDTTISKNGQNVKLKDAYSKLEQTVDGISTTVGSHETKWEDNEKTINTLKSKIEQNADSIKLKVESSYVNQVFNRTIKSVDVMYYLSTSSSSLADGSWVTTAPKWQQGKYIWTKTVTSYMSGETTETAPVCISGINGQNGATGQGISSITEEYYLSTSKTTQSGGSWVTTPPTWSVGKYMWTRSKIVYKNPTATAYTTPLCDSSWEAINDVQIGGRNLFLKSDIDKHGLGYWKNNGSGTSGTVEGTYIDGSKTIKVIGHSGIIYNSYIKLKRNTTYTYSMMMKSSSAMAIQGTKPLHMWLNTSENANHLETIISTSDSISTNTWTKVWIVFKTPNTQDVYYMKPFVYGIDTNTVHICKVKVEEGNKATDWTPAPEDVQASIDSKADSDDVYTKEETYTKSQTDSQIKIAKDNIELNVQSTYETKSNVESKISTATSSTLSSAKSYADTKKAEAISSASTDATNKVNSAKNELNNSINNKANKADVYTKSEVYKKSETYTKGETDSKIKVAKDEITLGVSNTYETKSNVESKITSATTSTLSSAKSYADTKKNEAISSASADATSKVNSAKNELNTAISNIKVGGRNLLSMNNVVNRDSANFTKNKYGVTFTHNSEWQGIQFYNLIDIMELNQTYILQYKIKKTAGSLVGIAQHIDSQFNVISFTVDGVSRSAGTSVTDMGINDSNWHTCIMEVKRVTNVAGDGSGTTNRIIPQPNRGLTTSVSVEMKDFQIEKGNKATDWTPAPEDIQSSLDLKANTTDVYKKSETYTKGETDSKIKVAKDEITLGVSNTYETKSNVESKISTAINNVQVGGRNLIPNSAPKINNYGWAGATGNRELVTESTAPFGYAMKATFTANTTSQGGMYAVPKTKLVSGKAYSWSVWLKASKSMTINVGMEQNGRANCAVTTSWQKFTHKFIANDHSNYAFVMYAQAPLSTGDYYLVHSIMVEEGNRPGSWTPAPEDVDSAINLKANSVDVYKKSETYTKGETDSKITVAKNEINLGVSNTYETKTNVTSKISSAKTEAINSAVNTSKSYADTKKAEAISSASTDATNKVNSAKSELNTAISKKANSTDVYTKSEVYTKGQTDSQIKVAKDEINLGVRNTYETKSNVESKISTAVNNIEIGGRNLIKQSKLLTNVSYVGWSILNTGNEGFKKLEIDTTSTDWQECSIPLYTEINTLTKSVTISFEYQESTSGVLHFNFGVYNSSGGRIAELSNLEAKTFNIITTKGDWKYVSFTFNPNTLNGKTNADHYRIQFKKVSGKTGRIQIRKPMLEISTKASSWTPAPEDVDSAINSKANSSDVYKKSETYTKGETDSKITVAKNEINLGVSNTYETKTNVTSKISSAKTEAINSAVNTSKSYADTKKAEAISSASADATSKVNSAKTELNNSINNKANKSDVYTKSEVYTKAQTDSQIKVAKDEINLGVSNTYETKTNVESKVKNAVNNIKIGGVNLFKDTKDFGHISMSAWNFSGGSHSNTSEVYKGCKVVRLYSQWAKRSQAISCEPNTEYVISAWVKGGNTTTSIGAYCEQANRVSSAWDYNTPVGTEWKRFWVVMRTTNYTSMKIRIEPNNSSNCDLYICGVMVEKGNKPSEWTPAPEDIDSAINLKANASEVYTKTQTDSQIKVAKDSITNTVSSNYLSKSDATNTYATKSSLTQTTNNITASFKASGGYNLISNSTGYNNTNLWTVSGATLGTDINNNIGGATNKYMYLDNGTKTSESFAFSRRFKIKANTKYTLSGWFHNYTKCPSFDVFLLSSTSVAQSDTGTSYTNAQHLINAQNTSGSWKKYSVTFTTPANVISGYIRIDNNGYNSSGTNSNRIHWSALMLNEGEEQPWSSHPDEAYSGIVKLDANGVEVSHTGANTTTHMNSKGFFIFNSQGETVGSLATETGLSVVNANKVYADNINTIYQGDANLYVNHNHTGSNLGTSDNPFRSFADLKRHLESQPVINKNVSIYVKTTSEITEQLTLTGLSGSGWIWIYYDKTCVHRQVTGGAYSIVLNNISNYIGIEGGRSNYNSSDGAVICDKWNAHGINITNCNNVYIGNINIHCQNWGIKVHRSRIRTWRVDFCGTWCCLDLSELSHGTDKDSCGGSAGGEFFRLYDGSIFLYGDTGGGYRPVGAKQEISGRYFLVGGERTATNSFRTPPPAPTTSDQYNTWSMNDYGYFTYGRNGVNVNKWNPSTRRIQQGEWSGYGNNYGFAFFDHSGIRNWLANGTPKDGSTITLKRASSGGYSSSQPIYLHGATNTSCSGNPSGLKSYGNIGSLAWGETKTFNLPTSLVNDLKSGAIKSLCFYDSSGASYVKLESVSIKLKANKPV